MSKRKVKVIVWSAYLLLIAVLLVFAFQADENPSIQPAMNWAMWLFLGVVSPAVGMILEINRNLRDNKSKRKVVVAVCAACLLVSAVLVVFALKEVLIRQFSGV